MPKISKLHTLSNEDIHRLVEGYTSPEKYGVTKHESDEYTELNLTLVSLDTPYVKRFGKDATIEASYFEMLKQEHSFGLWAGKELIGIAITEHKAWNNTLWLWEFHIAKKYQYQGYGKQLMNTLIKHGVEKEMRTIVCETQNTNVPAIRFYRTMGFSIHSIDISYYTNEDVNAGEVAIFMKRPLN